VNAPQVVLATYPFSPPFSIGEHNSLKNRCLLEVLAFDKKRTLVLKREFGFESNVMFQVSSCWCWEASAMAARRYHRSWRTWLLGGSSAMLVNLKRAVANMSCHHR
jgi:hypothetical protein